MLPSKGISLNIIDTTFLSFIYLTMCFFSQYKLDKLEEYGITSFGVSVTTLEEVFMKVGEGAERTLHDLWVNQ